EEPFIQLPQITDVDVDGSGTMYLSAWDGAGYSGSPDIGYVDRVVPRGWAYQPFADVTKSRIANSSDCLNRPMPRHGRRRSLSCWAETPATGWFRPFGNW